jgi:hypothetical protein
MSPTSILALLLAFLTALPVPASAFTARNSLVVFPTSDPRVMEVVGASGSGGSDFFCAAGEFARGPLGARASDRLVVVEPVSRNPRYNNRRSVRIAVVPRGTPVPRGGLILNPAFVGENLSVGHAAFLCNLTRRGRGFG